LKCPVWIDYGFLKVLKNHYQGEIELS